MPPKGADKASKKEKEKLAVDKTFGMKNKNKSKQVQKYVKQITSSITGAPKGGAEQAAREAREKKAEEQKRAALMNSLFNLGTDKKGRAFDPAAKKKAKQEEEESLAAGKKLSDELRKEIIEGIANSIRLTNAKGIRMSDVGNHPIMLALKSKHQDTFKNLSMLLFIKANHKVFWVDDPDASNPMLRCQEDVEAEVAPDERPIEEIIEEKRAALPPGGTPVTLETFMAWREKREAQRLAEVQAQMKDQKKKGGDKFAGLSGRDLFTFDASLFADDEDAASGGEYEGRSEAEDEDDNDGRTKGVERDADGEEDDADEEARPQGDGGARGSADPPDSGLAINKDLFLQAGDLPDDDDLPDDLDDPPPSDAQTGLAINKDLFLDADDLPDDLDDLDDDVPAGKK